MEKLLPFSYLRRAASAFFHYIIFKTKIYYISIFFFPFFKKFFTFLILKSLILTCVPKHEPTSLPITSLWVIPMHQPQACCILCHPKPFLMWGSLEKGWGLPPQDDFFDCDGAHPWEGALNLPPPPPDLESSADSSGVSNLPLPKMTIQVG